MYAEEIEQGLGCKELIDRLEQRFDEFVKKSKWNRARDTDALLDQIKVFFHNERPFRDDLFAGSRLSGSDCLTLATLTALLAKRKGADVKIGIPKKFSRLFHAVVVYQQDGKTKCYTIAGKKKYSQAAALSPSQVGRRIRYTKPLLTLANNLRRKKTKR